MKKYNIVIFGLILFVISSISHAAGEIYRYKNAEGNTVYSDRKPDTDHEVVKGPSKKSVSSNTTPEPTDTEQTPTPSRTVEEVKEITDTLKTDIDILYTELVNKNSETKGNVVVSFTIVQAGNVSHCAEDESEMQGAKFDGSICEKIRGLEFGEVEGSDPVRLTFTYNFGEGN